MRTVIAILCLFLSLSLFAEVNLLYYQLPDSFSIGQYPSRSVDWKRMMSAKERKSLQELCLKAKIPFSLILSDYDSDGIRDFTLSTTPDGSFILSAEDLDWDNDGIINIIDATVGDKVVGKAVGRAQFSHSLGSFRFDLKKLPVLADKDIKIESAVVSFALDLIGKYKFNNVEAIRASVPLFSYGQNAFFSFNPQSRVLEVYTDKFKHYLDKRFREDFKGVKRSVFINRFVFPVIIHSLAHELGHSTLPSDSLIEKLALDSGWTFKKVSNSSLYSTKMRMKSKHKKYFYKDLKYRGRFANDLLKEYKASAARDFLYTNKLPTAYSLTSLNEWFAESFAACLFRRVVGGSGTKEKGQFFEQLIGLRPDIVPEWFCKKVLK